MKKIADRQNVAISNETHKLLIAHIQKTEGKIGKFTDRAVRQLIEKESKQKS